MTELKRTRRPAVVVAQEKFDEATAAFAEFVADKGLSLENAPEATHPAFVGYITRQAKVDATAGALAKAKEKAAKSRANGATKRLNLTVLNTEGQAAVLAFYHEQLAANPADEDEAPTVAVDATSVNTEDEADELDDLLNSLT